MSANTDPQPKAPGPIVRYGLVVYLIGSFLWRVLTPAHEYPGRPMTYVEIALDILVVVGLIAIRAQLPKPLFWVALVAGVGMLAHPPERRRKLVDRAPGLHTPAKVTPDRL